MLNNRAVIYARYSSDNQREESIDAQLRACREYAQRQGYPIVGEYTDEARTGRTDQRPGFQQMVADAGKRMFDIVIVYYMSRISRSVWDHLFYEREFQRHKVRIISVSEPINRDDSESRLLRLFLQGISEYESEKTAFRVSYGMKESALQCKHLGGQPPLGYAVTPDRTYEIVEGEAQIVRRIFDMYINDVGLGTICNELNDAGYCTKHGGPFRKNSIHDILRNEKYRGVFVFNRAAAARDGKRNNHANKSDDEIVRVEGGMPAIISDEVWAAAQQRLERNRRAPGAYTAREPYLLSGILYCGKCGGLMRGQRRGKAGNGQPLCYYECMKSTYHEGCDLRRTPKLMIEKAVINYLVATLFTRDGLKLLSEDLARQLKETRKEKEKELSKLKAAVVGVEKKINRLVKAITEGAGFSQAIQAQLKTLEAERTQIITSLHAAEGEGPSRLPTAAEIAAAFERYRDIEQRPLDEQKLFIQGLVSRVVVYDDELKIQSTFWPYLVGKEVIRPNF